MQVCDDFDDVISIPIKTLNVFKMVNTLHISAAFPDDYHAPEFLARPAIADSKKTDPETGEVTYFRTFAYPPTSDYTLFDLAEIGHFNMDKDLSMLLNDDNLSHFTNLLGGCTIRKLSLVFEDTSMSNLHKLPALAARFQAAHVDFILARIKDHRGLAPFVQNDFSKELVKAGVREVTFNGEGIDGKGIQIPYQLLLNFFDAGIERITVNPGALIHKDVSRHILEKLVNKLADLGKPLLLDLHIEVKEGDSVAEIKAMKGVTIRKSENHKSTRNFTMLSIKYDGSENM
ncbi:hypothetical protein PRIPAC_71182 [Pristionchus pacificus]|uniref:Uncharacterized protein n=1 Tax=Pristionchus pacificus TaxID=54126 RepID=A0A2A6C7C7_PRIPA|nr:hypothetical protein PRIPAC_71182 [Pristionchus pacificus]|eukprot:PDM73963.1 hypothetical protein PRIPAC_41319 [Pristionchus pacificus]